MTQFPTPGHLASWAGVCPGSNESAGRINSTKTRPGNRYLKGALGVAALNHARTTKTYFSAKCRRLARRGPMKALVAVEHAMIIAVVGNAHQRRVLPGTRARLLHPTRPYEDEDPRRQTLETLGYAVTLQLAAQAG